MEASHPRNPVPSPHWPADLDYDGFALRNMDSVFDACGASTFCAVPDTMTPINPKVRGTYFNGGALILRPNRTTYEHLLRGAEADVQPSAHKWAVRSPKRLML